MQRRTFLGMLLVSPALIKADSKVFHSNVYLREDQRKSFYSVQKKLELVKKYIGFGNFNIISFDDILKISARVSKIGKFSKEELDFIEEIFYEDPSRYGFYGSRTMPSLTSKIDKSEVIKIPRTGHYLFKGDPLDSYTKAKRDVGSSLILTSGVRGIPKQMNLFFNKLKSTKENLTLAAHSLAPPAYSYHSLGDFDVGKKGWGYKNFTVSFVRTKEFWRLRRLPYISMRYTINNKDGVRFEPWHVKII